MASPTSYTGPGYYQRGSIEVWDFIRDQGLNFHLGNAIKYICRAGYKDSAEQDLTKAIHYLQDELRHLSTLRSISDESEAVPSSVSADFSLDRIYLEASAEFDR